MSNFKEITIGDMLYSTVKKFPNNDALVYPFLNIKETYSEFLQHCEAVAKGFLALGVKKNDHVSVWTTNLPEWVYMQFGLGMIGAVLVTVNTNYKTHELEYILKQSDSTTLVLMEGYRDTNFYDIVREVIPQLDKTKPGQLNSEKLPYLKNLIYIGKRTETPGMLTFEEFVDLGKSISEEQLHNALKATQIHDVINMQYTSGTTGFPKGVMLTHYNIVNNARMVGDVMGLTPDDE